MCNFTLVQITKALARKRPCAIEAALGIFLAIVAGSGANAGPEGKEVPRVAFLGFEFIINAGQGLPPLHLATSPLIPGHRGNTEHFHRQAHRWPLWGSSLCHVRHLNGVFFSRAKDQSLFGGSDALGKISMISEGEPRRVPDLGS